MSSERTLVDCAVCSRQVGSTQLGTHLASGAHLAQLTQRYHALSREHASQTAMLTTLQGVLDRTNDTIERLIREKDERAPVPILEWTGGPTNLLQTLHGASHRTALAPPATHPAGAPYPREFIEIQSDKEHIALAPIEYHGAFTIEFAMCQYSLRDWVRFFDAQVTTAPTPVIKKPNSTDWIEVNSYQKTSKDGLIFWISREGYADQQCIVERGAIKLQQWQHFTACIDHAGIMRLYIDGELRAQHQSTFTPKTIVRDQGRMAGRSNDFRGAADDENMHGGVSHLRIFNDVCLSGAEIYENFHKWKSFNRVN